MFRLSHTVFTDIFHLTDSQLPPRGLVLPPATSPSRLPTLLSLEVLHRTE